MYIIYIFKKFFINFLNKKLLPGLRLRIIIQKEAFNFFARNTKLKVFKLNHLFSKIFVETPVSKRPSFISFFEYSFDIALVVPVV